MLFKVIHFSRNRFLSSRKNQSAAWNPTIYSVLFPIHGSDVIVVSRCLAASRPTISATLTDAIGASMPAYAFLSKCVNFRTVSSHKKLFPFQMSVHALLKMRCCLDLLALRMLLPMYYLQYGVLRNLCNFTKWMQVTIKFVSIHSLDMFYRP